MKIVTSRYAQMGLALIIAVLLIAGVSGSAAAAGPSYHTVQPGQTLYSIANHYGTSVWAIACANGLYNPNYVYAGQVLVIPSGWDGGGCKSDHQYHPQQGCGCDNGQASWNPKQGQDGCGCDQKQMYPKQRQDGCGCDQQHASWYPQPKLGCYYTVHWGEGLYRIALRYGISWVVLAQGNGLSNGNYIYAGQVLRVPCAY
jgi:LysM repeat protein